ncbi:DEAD/DEAH box helicase [Egicoccus halophilus]|uniref:Helicase n=1 Tax=Egicoccus halophilus TaxID=1670830 RepID=A0A8J3EVS0_9ACTN|nr:DEAD/DEAH box helicase [Egicoccus halophilus]GGI09735.1 helicase [Egicoccus halophilus]
MAERAQLSFVPGDLVPASGLFAVWLPRLDGPGDGVAAPEAGIRGVGKPDTVVSEADDAALAQATRALDLPAGAPGVLAGVALGAGVEVQPRARPARMVALLPAVRRLAAMPPGPDWPAWSRPSASVLAWSVAAKLALELVAAGRLLPVFRPGDHPSTGLASWRVAAPSDTRLGQLAAALPLAAHAVRRPSGPLWRPGELLGAFLDAVADACAREGRRPELDPRRRGPRRPWQEMWADALAGSDPTVDRLRVPADEIAAEVQEWAGPLLGGDHEAVARLAVRLEPPVVGDDGRDDVVARLSATEASWRLSYLLQSTVDPAARIEAAEVWAGQGAGVELAGRRLPDPEVTLVRGLASAARLYVPIDRSLSEARPVGLDLRASEVASLLGQGADALAAGGIGVEVPPELRNSGDRRLRLRVRIGRGTELAPRVDGADPLGLTSVADLRYEVALGEDTLSADEFAEIVALKQPLVRWRGNWIRVDLDEVDRMAELAGQTASLELTEALAAALSGQHQAGELGWVDAVADGALGELIERLRHSEEPGDARIEHIEGDLRPYQRRGVAWLQRLTELGMGGVLADEMGLGKTLMAIALLTSREQDRPHLVVCPTSVVGNWERELARFAPEVPVVRHHGPERPVTRRAFKPGFVTVTSYALLRRDIGMLQDIDWDVVVFDEAQQIKNAASKGARAARSLTARARIAMTGTPIENRLAELWAIVDVTNPGLLGSQRAFNERFAVPVERWHDEHAASRLRRLVAPFVLRRRKADPEVSVDLPPKQELTVSCSLTREQASLYQAAIDQAFSGKGLGNTAFERRGRILALLTALKQICNHPAQYLRDANGPEGDRRLPGRSGKLARSTEILGEIVDNDERALVFTQFREMGDLLVRHLGGELGLPEVPFLHGGLPLPKRDEMVQRFQTDEDAPPILLVSLRAGGTGLNLTRASHVLHFDRWWNPAVEDQATDRVHRIGQTRAVTVHTLVTAGTIEERIAVLLDRKRALADAVVEAGETWITELDDDELRELVSLSTDDLADEDDETPTVAPGRPTLTAIPGGRA